MKRKSPLNIPAWGLAVLLVSGLTGQIEAELISADQYHEIITAPPSVIDDAPGAENTKQEAFNEAQSVVLPEDIEVDGGVIIPAGTTVDSHMIFLNTHYGYGDDFGVVWTFDAPILGVMSDTDGLLEAATNEFLKAPGTVYPGAFAGRGLELDIEDQPDEYEVNGNTITVGMHVGEPGDWIRVVTGYLVSTIEVSIDIKPGSDPNSINIGENGLLPVAVLGSADFDVNDIDPATINLGEMSLSTRGPAKAPKLAYSIEDVDGDGILDFMAFFSVQELSEVGALDETTTALELTGQLFDGDLLTGTDSVRPVPPI